MSGRVRGYHYVHCDDGKKHRVYSNTKKSTKKSCSVCGSNCNCKRQIKRGLVKVKVDRSGSRRAFSYLPKRSLADVATDVAGDMFAKIMGSGDYKITSNTLIGEGQSPARMHSSSAATRVTHREYITDIVSSSVANTFSLQSFSINPGLFTTFPWLSAIAQQYQEWVPLGIVFEFKTLSADAIASSTNNTLGGIIMATNYNSAASNFANKQAMDNTEYTTSYKPSESFYHAIECAPHQNVLPELYIRAVAVPSGQDQKTYDLGNFQIATFGIQGTSVVLGELWVSYDIELRKPISTAAQGLDVLSDHYKLGTVIDAKPLGTTSTLQTGSSIGGTITNGVTYNFNPYIQEGNYIVSYVVNGTGAAIDNPDVSATNGTILTVWLNDSTPKVNTPEDTVTSIRYTMMFVIKITGLNASFTFGNGGTLPASVTSGDLWVTQVNSAIVT